MCECKELAEENAQLKSLILMYQGEGEDEIPEEKEWRDLAEKKHLSPQETIRVRELAITIKQQCNATWLRSEVERLNQVVVLQGDCPDTVEEQKSFKEELCDLINRHSKENGSDTPDFILAEYLNNCLEAFDKSVDSRRDWYGAS